MSSEGSRISRRKLIKGAAAGAVGLAGLDALAVEPHWLQFQRLEIPIRGLGTQFDGYRIALLSDFHYPNRVSPEYLRKAFSMAMDFKPDIIAMPGDFVHARNDGDTTHQDVPALGSVFAGFGAPDGVIGVLGNHDHWRNAEGVRRELSASPIRLIDNSRIVVTRGASSLALAGLGDLWEGELNFDSALGGLSGNVPVILLEHNPDLAETMPDGYRVDLQLSGHTHGGQVRIPFGPAPVLPSRYGNKYREGLVEGPRHRVYVTRGVGFSSPIPVRFFCRPEVTGITLRIG